MIAAVDHLPKIIVKDKDDEADVFCSMTLVFEIIRFYGDREVCNDVNELLYADILERSEKDQKCGDNGKT